MITKEPVCVVILDECHHRRWVSVEVIIAERVVNAVQSLPPIICFLVLCLRKTIEEGEIHHRF